MLTRGQQLTPVPGDADHLPMNGLGDLVRQDQVLGPHLGASVKARIVSP